MSLYFYLTLGLLINLGFSEFDLLRSKYLTDDMVLDISKLDKYPKIARKIFNKYEKAKFYQMIAYTYYIKYQDLTNELESLEKQFQVLIQEYSDEVNLDFLKNNESAGIQNEFVPILFSEDDSFSIKLFKAKAGMFKKQYHEYRGYFNQKINLYNKELKELRNSKMVDLNNSNQKIYDDYNQFILNQESSKYNEPGLNTIFNDDELINEINWYSDESFFQRKFYYTKVNNNIKMTVDYKDNSIVLETVYIFDISDDRFLSFLMNEKNDVNFDSNGIFYNKYYNKFNQLFKTVYYQANGNIIGCILNFFEEELKLVGENWYIDDCQNKIREFKNKYDPKTQKYIWLESKYWN
ncbi:MAG: hypothetical protein CMG00_08670 [Candidatus Marinimicrobia bacterium]|nr:hypothetical protein [Candidatus Neomarinimicrobiota bacterium]|tara:strand:- start:3916 stop:4968 length:1053 start_codon:yes stop_codon:yes gene_type:complete